MARGPPMVPQMVWEDHLWQPYLFGGPPVAINIATDGPGDRQWHDRS